MKRFILYIVAMFGVCAMTSCDKEETFDVTPQTLAQTVWNAEIQYFDENGNATGNNSCIVEFLSETEGKYSEPDMNTVRRFTYEVDRAIIVIDSGIYTLLNGTWHIVEKSEQQILLQGYYPNKVLITLDRVL